jgi:hypothetical protein
MSFLYRFLLPFLMVFNVVVFSMENDDKGKEEVCSVFCTPEEEQRSGYFDKLSKSLSRLAGHYWSESFNALDKSRQDAFIKSLAPWPLPAHMRWSKVIRPYLNKDLLQVTFNESISAETQDREKVPLWIERNSLLSDERANQEIKDFLIKEHGKIVKYDEQFAQNQRALLGRDSSKAFFKKTVLFFEVWINQKYDHQSDLENAKLFFCAWTKQYFIGVPTFSASNISEFSDYPIEEEK